MILHSMDTVQVSTVRIKYVGMWGVIDVDVGILSSWLVVIDNRELITGDHIILLCLIDEGWPSDCMAKGSGCLGFSIIWMWL